MHGAREEEEEEGNGGVNAGRGEKRTTYPREFLLAVGSSEACKVLPAGVDMSKHPDDVKLWSSEAASRACSSRAETWRVRSAGVSGGSQGDLPQRARGESGRNCRRRFVSTSWLLALGSTDLGWCTRIGDISNWRRKQIEAMHQILQVNLSCGES
jgi:hypothetical protein